MSNFGVSSTYLAELAQDCLKKQPEIVSCDIFLNESELAVNKGFIINSQISDLPGSHFLCVLIKEEEIIYFDSLAFPILNAYIKTKLETVNKPIKHCIEAIQGANSVFCGLYCLSFLRSFRIFSIARIDNLYPSILIAYHELTPGCLKKG